MAGRPPSTEAPAFGKRVAALRKERGLTQMELADQLGVSPQMVDYYERRAVNPSLDLLHKLATAFGLTVGELLGETTVKAKKRPGPASALEEKFEQLRRLPKREQETVLKMLDGLLSTS